MNDYLTCSKSTWTGKWLLINIHFNYQMFSYKLTLSSLSDIYYEPDNDMYIIQFSWLSHCCDKNL